MFIESVKALSESVDYFPSIILALLCGLYWLCISKHRDNVPAGAVTLIAMVLTVFPISMGIFRLFFDIEGEYINLFMIFPVLFMTAAVAGELFTKKGILRKLGIILALAMVCCGVGKFRINMDNVYALPASESASREEARLICDTLMQQGINDIYVTDALADEINSLYTDMTVYYGGSISRAPTESPVHIAAYGAEYECSAIAVRLKYDDEEAVEATELYGGGFVTENYHIYLRKF